MAGVIKIWNLHTSNLNSITMSATNISKPSQADIDFLSKFCYNYTDINVPFSTATPIIPTGPELQKVDNPPLDLSIKATTKPPPGFESKQPNPSFGSIGNLMNQLPGVVNSVSPITSIGTTPDFHQLPNSVDFLALCLHSLVTL